MDADTLAEELAALGATPAAVADTLRRAGVRGRRGDCTACPVAVYLARRLRPGGGFVSAGPDRCHADGTTVRTPGPVFRFVADFDGGAHPDLEG